MRELVHLWGADRVMFGSDYPMWDPNAELENMLNSGLTDDELEKVLWRNAEEFSGVKVG
jgi:predicted TIM-barrel fold metal-dependent hydrolase